VPVGGVLGGAGQRGDAMIRVLDLFSGIGCMALGLQRAGAEIIGFCETDQFKRRVIARHWPGVPILGDITTAEFPSADFIAGGFPCQDLSRAGKRTGITGARSGLYRQLVRAFCVVRPKHGLVENVAALVGDGLDIVLGDLAACGFDTEWDCVPAKSIGAPHERDRVWIVVHDAGASADVSRSHDRRRDAGTPERQEREPRNGLGAAASADADREQRRRGTGRQDWPQAGNGLECAPDAPGDGRRQRRPGRPSDSFAWIRDAARWHAGHAYRAGLAEREGERRDTRSECEAAERAAIGDFWQSRWPREPALLGMDDGVAFRVERTAALGDALVPQIPELILRAISAAGGAG
jgi:DNA (cytosine-5)-methyltransferase 1